MSRSDTGPTPEQLRAIQAFANKHGAHWKSALLTAWLTGRDEREPHSHLLRQVRNRFGPVWLNSRHNSIKPHSPALT